MQTAVNVPCEMTLSNDDAHGRAMDHFISQMNSESEATVGLLEPLAIDDLDWETFARHSSMPPRLSSRTKRLVSLLRPKSRRQQVYQICEVLAEDELIKLKSRWAMVGILFRTTGDKVRSMYRNYKERAAVARPGRPKVLGDNHVKQLIQHVVEKAQAKSPMTRGDIIRYAHSEWGIDISKRTVNRVIKETQELTTSVAFPMERPRAEVTRDELEAFYRQLAENLEGVLPESIVNLDEVGFSRRCRGSPLPCVIPAALDGRRIEYVPNEEHDSTFTVLTAVTLNGEALTPYIVAPVKSLPNDFLTESVWTYRDCVLDFNESGFANGRIVSEWYSTVFTEWLRVHRFKIKQSDAPVVLICDGFSGHCSEELRAFTARDNVRLIFLPAHSSHLTQALDKYVFAVMKQTYNRLSPDANIADRNGRKIDKLLKAFYSSCISPQTIRESWKAIGVKGLHDAAGQSIGVEVNGAPIITRHVDLGATSGYQRRRRLIQHDYLANRQGLARAAQGLCPHCGQPPIRPQPARPAPLILPQLPGGASSQ